MTTERFKSLDFEQALCAFSSAVESEGYFTKSKLTPCKRGFYFYFQEEGYPARTHLFYSRKGLDNYIEKEIGWDTMKKYLLPVTEEDVEHRLTALQERIQENESKNGL